VLKTVRVPPEFAPLFTQAEEIVSRYFRDRRDDPEHGTIEIFGERYVLVRAASLSVEFFSLVADLYGPGREREADEFARNILFDLAHAIGRSDAQNFHAKMGLVDPIAKLSAGPLHFSHTGWAFVDIFPESKPSPDEDYFLVYDHPYSFESDAWLRAGKTRESPACIMNAGYSSGWCEESFGVTLVATEVLCRARGDAACRFVMAHPNRIEKAVERWAAKQPRPESAASYSIPDFFARKRMEEELRRAQGDLERRVEERTAELLASNERLKREIAERKEVEKKLLQAQKLEAIGRLAGGIAHDFNNLMAVIIGNAGLLAHRVREGDALRPFVDEISSAGRRAAQLTHQLLAFSRARALSREPLDVNRIVRDLSNMLARVIGEDIELVTNLDEAVGIVEADRGQVEQVVMNLVVNGRDAMAEARGGRLVVETRNVDLRAPQPTVHGTLEPGSYVLLAVTDTGTGMSEEVLSQIFDPFFTTKEGKRTADQPTGGTGLGLSTVYGIVKQAGGGIVVTTTPGHGSRFALYFPRLAAEAEARASLPRLPLAERGSETVLVVEDQEALRVVMAKTLRELGYDVLLAGDGEDALSVAAVHDGPIHLLVTDVVMPKLRGPELARRLTVTRPTTRVLYTSGYPDDPSLAEAEGPTTLLPKPFTPEALGRRVREVLDE
jgi:signal transduction histidine kinase